MELLASMSEIARYYVARPTSVVPRPQDGGFDLIWAGNGIFKRARNRHLEACIPVTWREFPGLLPLIPYVRLLRGRLPGHLLAVALQDARMQARAAPVEAMYHICAGGGRIRLYRPRQQAGVARLAYQGGGETDVVCDLHSHCEMGAFFSSTDDGDELGFRLYAVMGRIFSRPEVRMRVGVWGDWWPVAVGEVFEGEDVKRIAYSVAGGE